jgi:lipoate-protein ligase A
VSLSAEPPAEALARDEALLDQVAPGGPTLVRWYTASAPAMVLGLGAWHHRQDVVDLARCQAAGVQLIARRAGGGAVLLDANMLCAAICVPLPDPRVPADLTASYHWLGEGLARALRQLGLADVERVDVAQARADVRALAARTDAPGRLLLDVCYGALSPHEVLVHRQPGGPGSKIVGLAQVRRRHAALFQLGLLLHDQSPLADLLRVEDEATRDELRQALRRRTVGLADVLPTPPDLGAIVQACNGALHAPAA